MRLFDRVEDLHVIHTALKTQMDIYIAQIGKIDEEIKAKEDKRPHPESFSREFQEACNNMAHCEMLLSRIETKTKGLDHIRIS